MAEPTNDVPVAPSSSNMDVTMEDDDAASDLNSVDSIPARPPTPPRDTTKPTPAQDNGDLSQRSEYDLPESSAECPATGQNRRVNFSPYINWYQPWKYDNDKLKFPSLRSIATSETTAQPLPKSILKPFEKSIILISEKPDGLTDFPMANTNTPFAELLESVVQALASSERTKKSDTYASFANTLRAYDGVPDIKLLADKLDLILSFIKRDFNAMIPDVGTPDTTLIRQACKVLIIFAWLPETVGLISDEDVNYFLNFAIEVLDQGTSKALSTNYLYFLSQQKFPSRLMTQEKVTKILQVAGALKDKQKGNSVDLERLSLYARLLLQAKGAMIQNADLWVDHVFQGLMSTTSPTRLRAMTLAAEMEKEFGKEKNIARAVNKLFPSKKDKPNDVNKKRPFIQKRLEKMLESKDDAVFVPQIWGFTISLLRGLSIPVDRWEHFSPFLGIMSKCFNSSEQNLNIFAQIAWSKLIYASNLSVDTTQKNFELLLRPIVGYIDESKGTRHTKQAKKAAISNVHTLMYYAFRPGASAKQIEHFWDAIVEGLVAKYLLNSQNFIVDGCNILNGLFSGSAKWVENRVSEGSYITAAEIPRLDPKWIRANSSLIFKALEVAVRTCLKIKDQSEIPHLTTWKKLMANIAESAKKEIRISAEMMEFVASLLGFLKRLWTQGFAGKKLTPYEDSQFMTHFVILVQLAIQELGTACFTEKWLAEDGNDQFAAVSTPSGKFMSNSNNVVQHPPLWHLFRLFIDPFKGAKIGDNYARPISNVLLLCVDAQDSRRKKISLLAQGIAVLPTHDISEIHKTAWSILAEICGRVLPAKGRDTMASALVNGPEIRDVLTILEWGYHHCGREEFPQWRRLYTTVYETVQSENGIAYLGPAVIDPLSEVMRLPKIDLESTMALDYITLLAEGLQYPNTSVQYERVYKSLFGDQARKHAQVPYTSFFEVMGQAFRRTYDLVQVDLVRLGNTSVHDFFRGMQAVAEKLPKEHVGQMVSCLQDGFALWLTCDKPADKNMIQPVAELLTAVCDGLKRTESFDSMALRSYSHLVAAGFESKSQENVITMIEFWNKTFGIQENLEYPARVRTAINKLRRFADIKLPTFPDSIEDLPHGPPPVFMESQGWNLGQNVSSSPKSTVSPFFYRELQAPSSGKSSKASSHPSKQITSKLRHMDSQIEYQPIYADENDDPDGLESQLMTDHQKEVRDRQALEAGMFKDLNSIDSSKRGRKSGKRSGSRSRSKSADSPMKLDLRIPNPMASDTGKAASSPVADPSSPIEQPFSSSPGLPVAPSTGKFAALIDRAVHFPTSDDIPSSPTARISRDSFVPQLDDIPSSPPLAPADLAEDEPGAEPIEEGAIQLDTVDPKSIELSQGSKIRIEEGELPPNLTEVVKNIPRSPMEALELQDSKQVKAPVIEPAKEAEQPLAEPSQVEDISVHLVSSQMEEDVQPAPVLSEAAKTPFSTAPENAGETPDEVESVDSNIPDSPSSKVSSNRLDSPEASTSTGRRIGHKRKRSKGQPAPPQNANEDEEMLDAVSESHEMQEAVAPTPKKDSDGIQHPPAKKARATTGESPVVATRQQPPRTRRSLFSRSVSDSGEFSPSNHGRARSTRNTKLEAEGVQEMTKPQTPKSNKKEKKDRKDKTPSIVAGSVGVQTRRARQSAASYLSVPDSQSPAKVDARLESTPSLPSAQDVRFEVVVTSTRSSLDAREAASLAQKKRKEGESAAAIEHVRQPASLVEKLDALLEEMKKMEFTSDELTKLDGTAFDIMHWVRQQQKRTSSS
ncbi:hypothetical protein Dda_3120 [Drechslerella dactyloides]|uniref:Telomere-associated protein Rif1 N-terminal domain-containing protein n=1 Tax=Drechslerella dactyloides TaxID=74499 RepID=A0AAD6NMJ9_DREDA|nr:hypothetical protein Dda_3120 [Drechslerella dactyloides]